MRQRDGALDDIHRAMRPHADAVQVAEHVAHELAIEASHAFAYTPVMELIAEAKRRGLKVVIVSDMYLNEAQLRHIEAAAAPTADAMELMEGGLWRAEPAGLLSSSRRLTAGPMVLNLVFRRSAGVMASWCG